VAFGAKTSRMQEKFPGVQANCASLGASGLDLLLPKGVTGREAVHPRPEPDLLARSGTVGHCKPSKLNSTAATWRFTTKFASISFKFNKLLQQQLFCMR
jgi:hypothetical protein